jgi:hypothetical protein
MGGRIIYKHFPSLAPPTCAMGSRHSHRFRSRRGALLFDCVRQFQAALRVWFFGCTHHDEPLVATHTHDRIVAGGPPRCRVDKYTQLGVDGWGGSDHGKHNVEVGGAEQLLGRVETKTGQFTLNEVGSISHHVPESSMPSSGLPPRPPPHTDSQWGRILAVAATTVRRRRTGATEGLCSGVLQFEPDWVYHQLSDESEGDTLE